MDERGSIAKEAIEDLPTVEPFTYSPESWAVIKDAITAIDAPGFGGVASTPESMENFSHANFSDPRFLTYLLRKNGEVIGYTQACQWGISKETAEILRTAITPDEQGKKYVGVLFDTVEEELRNKGFTRIIRRARIANGYAEKVKRHYGDRVVSEYRDINPKYQNFMIKL